MNNAIVDFYLNVANDDGIPNLDYVLNGNTEALEGSHTWCQRAFPNYEPSEVVPGSPVLDDETLKWLKDYCKDKILALTFRFLNHYSNIMTHEYHHNNLRVTRLLKFLVMLDFQDAAHVVFRHCLLVHADTFIHDPSYCNTSLKYWMEALHYTREKNNNETK
jgi:hypothetical protein